mmetsp:Transcript_75192/g.125389  ORF Transcript_75192/g.125389 Transcript_75192/m.125389 type:complete len:281 (+) Transcript_75192:126-968(+)
MVVAPVVIDLAKVASIILDGRLIIVVVLIAIVVVLIVVVGAADHAIAVALRDDESAVVEPHLIRCVHPLRHPAVTNHEAHHRAGRPHAVPHPALDNVANREAQRAGLSLQILGRRETIVERRRQKLFVEVLADEDHLALARFPRLPRLLESTVERHVHRMVDEFLLHVRDREHAFHPEDVLARRIEQVLQERLRQLEIVVALLHGAQVARRALVEAHARDALVVLRRRVVRVEQLRLDLQGALQVEATDAEHLIDGDVAARAPLDWCKRIDATQARLNSC